MYISPEIVIGFHGCDQSVADSVLKFGNSLTASENDYDWLGHGIYFWEGSYERAFEWASMNRKVKNPSVIGAFIKLGNCLDLLDSKDITQVQAVYEILEQEFLELDKPLPRNKVIDPNGISFVRELDCQVILRLHQLNSEAIAKELEVDLSGQGKRKVQRHPGFIDSVRGMFPEGEELYSGAGFRSKNHIQLCILNPNCIIGYFSPRKQNRWYKEI